MYLAEDRVRVPAIYGKRSPTKDTLDFMLGACLETRLVVDPALREVGIRSYGRSRPGAPRVTHPPYLFSWLSPFLWC
jgi:hypothetical protein